MVTVAWSGVPAVTSAGRLAPKLSLTLSSSSLSVVGLGGEGEGHGGVAAVEGDALRHAGVVGRGRPSLVRRLDGDDYRPLGVGAQRDRHLDGVLRHIGGPRVVALGHGVGRIPELHRDRGHVVVGDGHCRLGRCPGGDSWGQGRTEAQPDALSVVVLGVRLGGEGEGLRGVATVENDVGGTPV